MKEDLFYNWLKGFKKFNDATNSSRRSKCRRIEKSYGDLDELYESDQCATLLEKFTYTVNDKNLEGSPRHNIPIQGDIYAGTNSLKAALKLYVEFRDNRLIEELKITPDIIADKHDGSYELVRETVSALATVPVEQLDICDLNLLYLMVVGTWRSGVEAKRQKIMDSNLNTSEKERLALVLDRVRDKAVQHFYENFEADSKNTDWSIGMFGTGFQSFAGKSDKISAQRFITLCVNLQAMTDDHDMFEKVQTEIDKGIRGMQSAAASVMLHCLKPNVFPIMNNAVNDKAMLFELEGIKLEKTEKLAYYIQNAKELKKFRDEQCIFKNYRAMDRVLSIDGRENIMDDNLLISGYEAGAGAEEASLQGFINYVQANGFYFPEDTLKNYVTALKTKPFVILSGISGTGKTQIARLFAKYMCGNEDSRHCFIAVRPDWLDNRSLLGFYNPITNCYTETNLLTLMLEASQPENKSKPYFVIFDEMNLAKVEYYFSDFLSCMESRDEYLELHSLEKIVTKDGMIIPGRIRIPDNVYFTGTVNIDETTYMFSPKVLDRANVIEINEVNLDGYRDALRKKKQLVLTDNIDGFVEWFTEKGQYHRKLDTKNFQFFNDEDFENAYRYLKEVNQILAEHNLHFGFRVVDEVLCFISNAIDPMVGYDVEKAFDCQMLQKILPKLHGNRKKLEEVLVKLEQYCKGERKGQDDENNEMTETVVLPHSAAKLSIMLENLKANNFVSFIE